MKKFTLLLIIAINVQMAFAQQAASGYTQDKDLSRWVIDLNVLGGGYTQTMDIANTAPNYLNGVNLYTGKPDFVPGGAIGGDAQVGFFFGKNRHWGIGTGLMYMREWGNLKLDSFHAEYQSTDYNGNILRQVVTTNNVTEQITTNNFDIPLLLKYKNRFSKHWGFSADAGALINLQMNNAYRTNASFDYEADYNLVANNEGGVTSVYDPSPTPSNSDFLITKAQYLKNNPDGNVQEYFNEKRSEGYSVGLGVSPNNKNGMVSYETGSVGVLFQPSVNYFLSDHVALNIGGYFLYQPFNNAGSQGYTFTDKIGDYNSMLNTASHIESYSYGGNVGVRFFLGKKAPALVITTGETNPTVCGLCDGGIVLHGLPAGKPATVSYNENGAAATSTFSGVAGADGTLKLSGMCAGTYTGIIAKTGKRSAEGAPVTLTDPPLEITSAQFTNPTAQGACDGTIKIFGPNAGQNATVTYSLNNSMETTFAATVMPDNSITLTGLCEGTYTNITVAINKCSASLTNPVTIKLAAPVPPQPQAPEIVPVDISTPILFAFNKSVIPATYYPLLDDAIKDLQQDNMAKLRVDAHTDAIGPVSYNDKLSVRRALAVKTYLKKKGIAPERVSIYGHGKSQPAASNKTAEDRAKNRRAVMQLVK